ncbi:MAG: glycosyltransferase family 4 protein [Armatimonadota bacterium]
MKGRINTVHIEFGRHMYGGALQVVYLMRGLAERGHGVDLVCAKGSAIETEARRSGIPVHPVSVWCDCDPSLVLRVYSEVRKVKPDVVHLHSRRGAEILGGVAARMARVPAVVLSRRVDDRISLGALGRLKYNVIPDKIIAISGGIKKVLSDCGIDEERLELVHSAIITAKPQCDRDRKWFESEFGISQDAPVAGVIAQLIERKGHRYFFSVIPDILKEFPDARFLIFGKGPLRAQLESRVQELGISEEVQFAGFREDMNRILTNLDVVVHPALREGLGVSLLQAAYAGVPIVASAVGGIPEIVRDGETGFLIQPEDTEAIKQSVLKLFRDRELGKRFGENGRRLVQSEFSVDQMVDGNLRVYRDVLQNALQPNTRKEVA